MGKCIVSISNQIVYYLLECTYFLQYRNMQCLQLLFYLFYFSLLNVIVCVITRQQKTEVRKAYRTKVMEVENDGQVSGTVKKHKKGTKDDGISVSMMIVEEVSY